MPPTAVHPGAVLAGKFRVDSVVGVGGMGMVVSAHHLALDRRVALKLMLPKAEGSADLSARFLREARAAARLQGEHVTRVLDVGTLDDGAPYIVMELLDGVDLATVLRRTGRVPVATAAALVLQASRAVAEAHAAGIVHRDLKPANLFVTRRRDGSAHVKVLDLGVCKLLQPDPDLVGTSTATVIGTPAYMAPEQMRSAKQADARSDIWSLGVILYELVSGRLPFCGQTYAEVCLRAALDPCPPLDVADAPAAFAAIVMRCLDKDPDRRPQTVDDLIDALAPHAGAVDLPSVARRRNPDLEPTVAAMLPAASVHPSAPPRRTWRAGAAVFVLGGVAAIASLASGRGATAALEVPAAPLLEVSPIDAAVEAAAPRSAPEVVGTPSVDVSGAPAASGPPPRRRRRARATTPAVEPAPIRDPLGTPD